MDNLATHHHPTHYPQPPIQVLYIREAKAKVLNGDRLFKVLVLLVFLGLEVLSASDELFEVWWGSGGNGMGTR